MPQLQDPNFQRSVVLLVEHNAEGTFGLVLNRPSDLTALDICSSLELDWKGSPEKRIHWGGPVQVNTGWVVFGDDVALELPSEVVNQVVPGLCFAGSLGVLQAVAEAPPQDLRLFLGYAGWGPGQLEGELAAGAWLLAPCSPDVVFAVDSDAMWDFVVRGLGVDPATLISTSADSPDLPVVVAERFPGGRDGWKRASSSFYASVSSGDWERSPLPGGAGLRQTVVTCVEGDMGSVLWAESTHVADDRLPHAKATRPS